MKSEPLAPILEGITQTFGPHCTAALVELGGEATPIIVAISNGELISRSAGDSAHPFWRSPAEEKRTATETVTTKDGIKFRCSSVRLTLPDGQPAGLLIVLDLTVPLIAHDFFRTLLPSGPPLPPLPGLDLSRALDTLLGEAVARMGRPVTLMGKDDKLDVIRYLDEHGVFLLRGSVEDVARELQISRFTVYNYLDEIKASPSEQ